MFLVKTAVTAFGTPSAKDALARLRRMERAGDTPTLTSFGGKTLLASDLQRRIGERPAKAGLVRRRTV